MAIPTNRMLRKSPNSFSFSRMRIMNEAIKRVGAIEESEIGYFLLQVPVLKTIH